MTKFLINFSLLSIALVLLPTHTLGQFYHVYMGEYPSDREATWAEGAQGVTHDLNHWFITPTEVLWKIPVEVDLNTVSANSPGVMRIKLSDIPQLSGFNHFGDPAYYEFNGQGYIFIPLEGQVPSAAAVLKANNLAYVDHTSLPQSKAGWIAISPDGEMYTSESKIEGTVNRFSVNWNLLENSNELHLTQLSPVTLQDETGASITITVPQGGVISSDGELLYLVAGGSKGGHPSWGIHIFNLQTGRRILRSTNGSGLFNYEFHPGFPDFEEPEGMTIWELDDGRAPGIVGQLHVLMLDNDGGDLGDDDIHFKHYSNKIFVDGSADCPGIGRPGKPACQIKTAIDAALPGDLIMIKNGTYEEAPLVINKKLTLIASQGVVVIGSKP